MAWDATVAPCATGGIWCHVGRRKREHVEIAFGRSAEFGRNPFDQSSLFEISDCILDLSLRHENRLRQLYETDQTRVSSKAMRDQHGPSFQKAQRYALLRSSSFVPLKLTRC